MNTVKEIGKQTKKKLLKKTKTKKEGFQAHCILANKFVRSFSFLMIYVLYQKSIKHIKTGYKIIFRPGHDEDFHIPKLAILTHLRFTDSYIVLGLQI